MPRAIGARAPQTVQEFPRDFYASQSGTVMMSVKAQNGAIVYAEMSDVADPIGEDAFIAVPLTPTISQAIRDGDLVKDPEHPRPFVFEDPERTLGKPKHRAIEAKVTEANPMPTPAPSEEQRQQQRQPEHRRPGPPPRRPAPTPPAE